MQVTILPYEKLIKESNVSNHTLPDVINEGGLAWGIADKNSLILRNYPILCRDGWFRGLAENGIPKKDLISFFLIGKSSEPPIKKIDNFLIKCQEVKYGEKVSIRMLGEDNYFKLKRADIDQITFQYKNIRLENTQIPHNILEILFPIEWFAEVSVIWTMTALLRRTICGVSPPHLQSYNKYLKFLQRGYDRIILTNNPKLIMATWNKIIRHEDRDRIVYYNGPFGLIQYSNFDARAAAGRPPTPYGNPIEPFYTLLHKYCDVPLVKSLMENDI